MMTVLVVVLLSQLAPDAGVTSSQDAGVTVLPRRVERLRGTDVNLFKVDVVKLISKVRATKCPPLRQNNGVFNGKVVMRAKQSLCANGTKISVVEKDDGSVDFWSVQGPGLFGVSQFDYDHDGRLDFIIEEDAHGRLELRSAMQDGVLDKRETRTWVPDRTGWQVVVEEDLEHTGTWTQVEVSFMPSMQE
jgi:hypothetical protein